MRVVVVGAGYVGLVTGACLAEFGHFVSCIDNDAVKIRALTAGNIPIYEPLLEDVIQAGVRMGRLDFGTDLAEVVPSADAVFIAVGTPGRHGDGHADLSYVYQVALETAKHLSGYTIVATKSTVPVGTGRIIRGIITRERPGLEFDIASNPEFLREGSAIEDFRRPDRVIVGCESERARAVMREIYRPLYLNETPILFTSPESAELIKYASNAFLATKITFINEMADLCEAVDADIGDVARGIGLDKRIGPKFLHAGPGFGGSCFPKDTMALLKTSQDHNAACSIIDSVVTANDRRKSAMADRIVEAFDGSVAGKTIAVLGLTFKPNTDDMREAPSLSIIPRLQDLGATIRGYDPEGLEQASKFIDIVRCKSAYDAMHGADGMVLLTEWNEFRALDFSRAKSLLRQPLLVDLRNVYRPGPMEAAGFKYVSTRPPGASLNRSQSSIEAHQLA